MPDLFTMPHTGPTRRPPSAPTTLPAPIQSTTTLAATLRANLGNLGSADRTFAESLLDQHARRSLSDRQAAWLGKLAQRAAGAPDHQPVILGAAGAAIWIMMGRAAEHLQHPKIRLRAGNLAIRLSIAGERSRTPGAVIVTTAERAYDARKFLGRILAGGRFEPAQDIPPGVVEALKELGDHPEEAAAQYGRTSGSCCFCGLELTDARSIKVGYGKICAGQYQLDWGAR